MPQRPAPPDQPWMSRPRRRDSAGYHRFMDTKFWPLMGAIAMVVTAAIQHSVTSDKVDKAKTEVKAEVKAEVKTDAVDTTKRVLQAVARPANDNARSLDDALSRIAQLELAIKALSAVSAAHEKDFVVEGRPATRRIDAGLVKVVRDNAATAIKALEARKKRPPATIKLIPLELPPAPVKNDHPTVEPVIPATPQLLDAGLARS